ncbi:AMP-binding protein [soil metagenome]
MTMTVAETAPEAAISYGERIRNLAESQPDVAVVRMVVNGEETGSISYADLNRAADRLARRFLDLGANDSSFIAIALPNGIAFYVALVAAWRIGACPVPLKYDMTAPERRQFLDLLDPAVLIGNWHLLPEREISDAEINAIAADTSPVEPVADIIPQRCWAIASGGSTGKPKIILNCRPGSLQWQFVAIKTNYGERHIQLICTPLYHTSALSMSVRSLMDGDTLIVLPRFEASAVVDAVDRYQVTLLALVATTMVRILRLPGLDPAKLKSIKLLIAGAGAIADEVLHGWADIVGAGNIAIGYGASEGIGSVTIGGDDLLLHPGTVGRPTSCDVLIVDEDGNPLPRGEVGELFLRAHSGDSHCFDYIGGEAPRKRPDGFVSVGDLAWLDEEGYLYISDRRTDMVKTGGVNVFPAEVEAVLHGLPTIADAVVIGLPDPDWGRKLHAILVAVDPRHPPEIDELNRYLRERLVPQKVPKSFEFVDSLGRAETMKLNRTALAEARISARDKEKRV